MRYNRKIPYWRGTQISTDLIIEFLMNISKNTNKIYNFKYYILKVGIGALESVTIDISFVSHF